MKYSFLLLRVIMYASVKEDEVWFFKLNLRDGAHNGLLSFVRWPNHIQVNLVDRAVHQAQWEAIKSKPNVELDFVGENVLMKVGGKEAEDRLCFYVLDEALPFNIKRVGKPNINLIPYSENYKG
jgi:hypothetical protein